MENKNFKILHVGHGKKKMSNICNKYLYSQGLNFIRPFDESYRKINEKNLEEIKELIPNFIMTEPMPQRIIRPTQKCDALITEYDFSLVTFPADCEVAGLVDYKKGIKALVHSGWRGTLKEILPKTIFEFLLRGSKIQDIQVILGPMLLKENFEIKDDYIDDFKNYISGLGAEKKIISYNVVKDCYNIDLFEIILQQLKNIGIRNIDTSLVEDTYSAVDDRNNLRYHSYRRDKDDFRNICLFM